MRSWQRGHPSDRRKTTMETEFPSFLFSSKLSIPISSESIPNIEPLRMAWRGFEDLTASDGLPENIVGAQPQSSLSLLEKYFLGVTKEDRDDTNVLLGATTGCPFLD